MEESLADEASDLYMNLFSPDWRKFILPVFMTLILAASALATVSLRQSPEMEQRTDLTAETMLNMTSISLETRYFNDTINMTQEQMTREVTEEAYRREKDLKPGMYRQKAMISYVQRSGLFPFIPETYVPLQAPREEYLGTAAVVSYRMEKMQQIGERLNSTENVSYSEYNEEVKDLREVTWRSEEVKDHLRNFTGLTKGENNLESLLAREDIRKSLINENVGSLKLGDYAPALAGTFLLYFVLNSVIVEAVRKAYSRRKDN